MKRALVPPADWRTLMSASSALHAAPDATAAYVLEHLGPEVPYNRVLSRHNSWLNKYARCTQRGLIPHPMRLRRNRLDGGGYEIEAVLDLTPRIETVMMEWPDD
jgi:hypothetical protein